MRHLFRRLFLASTTAAGVLGTAPVFLTPAHPALAMPATTIRAAIRVIEVNGRPVTVFGLFQPDGSHGLITEAKKRFRLRLENDFDEMTLIHWHRLTSPWQQDGVPDFSQPPLAPCELHDYSFVLERPGTNWMHLHHGPQEQRLLAAPLIVRDSTEAGQDVQEFVVIFHDFTFGDPDEILAELRAGGHAEHGAAQPHGGIDHGAGHGDMGREAMGASMVHLHDVDYDAFLANDRTLDDPDVFRVERGGRVRLRCTATTSITWPPA